MNVASISPGTISQIGQSGSSAGRSTIRHQAHQDFEQVVKALKLGNLAAAQQAYADFQQLRAGSASVTPTDATGTDNPPGATTATTGKLSAVASDWAALGEALQSGKVGNAQDAFAKLRDDAFAQRELDLQNAQAAYALIQGPNPANPANPANAATAKPPTAGDTIKADISSLKAALQSGDNAGAQQLLAKLEQDLKASGSDAPRRQSHHHGGFARQDGASLYAASAQLTNAASIAAISGGSSSSGVTVA